MRTRLSYFLLLFASLSLSFTPGFSQTEIKKGTVVRIKVHGKSLEGNLQGDPADRNVSVYLPASYGSNPKRHYPVVYFLHGFTNDDAQWYGLKKHWINLPAIIDTAVSQGRSNEMIFVTPDAYTRFQGSWYSNSITTGNWEDFVAKELVEYIDNHYRTIPQPAGRGIAGHSMGGYGAMRIGEKYPDIFSSVYLLSPATLSPPNFSTNVKLDAVKTVADFEKSDFYTKVAFALAAAWSPDLNNPPLYLQLPVRDGQAQADVQAKWIANTPITSVDQYIGNIRKLKAIGFDAGDKDVSIAQSIKVLDSLLSNYKVKHQFEIYEGTHTNKISERISQKMLGFFSGNLMLSDKRRD
jgi:enterochelin esterase-like enzyme